MKSYQILYKMHGCKVALVLHKKFDSPWQAINFMAASYKTGSFTIKRLPQ